MATLMNPQWHREIQPASEIPPSAEANTSSSSSAVKRLDQRSAVIHQNTHQTDNTKESANEFSIFNYLSQSISRSSKISEFTPEYRKPHQPTPPQTCIFPVLPNWQKSYDHCPLRQRGWALQERELSVRSVFYTSDQMLWECQSQQATEQFPTPWKRDKNATWTQDQHRLFFPRSQSKAVNFHRWYDMVEDYTKRNLSYQIDRLPAISGLAECFEMATGLRSYVAGLWGEDLIDGLLWSVRRDWTSTPCPAQSEEFRAPSWSWATVDEPVEWWSRHLTKHWTVPPNLHTKPSILHVETRLHGSDPRGRLAGGRLSISGIIKSVSVKTEWPSSHVHYGSGQSGDFCWDFSPTEPDHGFVVLAIYLAPPQGHIRHSLGLLLIPTGEKENPFKRLGLISHLSPIQYRGLERQVIELV